MELTVRKAFALKQSQSHLPERIAVILVHSPLAALIGREPSTRMNYLFEIASLHTRAELLAQPGLGRTGVRRIEKWMAFHGHHMRDVNESPIASSAVLRSNVLSCGRVVVVVSPR